MLDQIEMHATVRAPAAEPSPVELDGVRVLLAEDNVVNQAVAVAMLKSFGCRVDLAKNGLEAVSAVEREPFDLVLIDCHMPGGELLNPSSALSPVRSDGNANERRRVS
jgi:CheY-like chemotaxis protein